MVRLVVINNSPLVNVMRPLTAKVRVSPGLPLAIAWRSEPGPLSAVVVTMAANAQGECSIAMTIINGIDLFIFGLRLLVPPCALKHNESLSDDKINKHCSPCRARRNRPVLGVLAASV